MASRCERNQLIRCDSGREQRYACDAVFDGGTCVTYGRGGASCGFGPDCGAAATCNGNVAQLCVLGAQIAVDCAAAGFSRCALARASRRRFRDDSRFVPRNCNRAGRR